MSSGQTTHAGQISAWKFERNRSAWDFVHEDAVTMAREMEKLKEQVRRRDELIQELLTQNKAQAKWIDHYDAMQKSKAA
jgi:hypothetical protein